MPIRFRPIDSGLFTDEDKSFFASLDMPHPDEIQEETTPVETPDIETPKPDYEANLQAQYKQKEQANMAMQFLQQIEQQAKQDPRNWTEQQSKEYFKANPPQTPEQEAQMEVFLEIKKQGKEKIKQTIAQGMFQQQMLDHFKSTMAMIPERDQRSDYDKYQEHKLLKEAGENKEYAHNEILQDPRKMSVLESFAVPYVKGVAGFFTRPFGVEPMAWVTPEEMQRAKKEHPIASGVGEAAGGIVPFATALTVAPETLLGQVLGFGTAGGIKQFGKERAEGSLMDREGSNKRIVKETVKSAAYAPLWYYTTGLSMGGPLLSATVRAGTRGVGAGGIEKGFGASNREAVMTGLSTAALSGLFELTPMAIDRVNSTLRNKSLDSLATNLVKNDGGLREQLSKNYQQRYGTAPSEKELTDLIRAGLVIETTRNNIPLWKIVKANNRIKNRFETPGYQAPKTSPDVGKPSVAIERPLLEAGLPSALQKNISKWKTHTDGQIQDLVNDGMNASAAKATIMQGPGGANLGQLQAKANAEINRQQVVEKELEKANKGREISPVEQEAQDFVKNNYEEAEKKFIQASIDEFKAPNVVGADVGKNSLGVTPEKSIDLHEAGSALSKAVTIKYLSNPATLKKDAMFLAGGSGAGKSTALHIIGTKLDDYALVFDTNLNKLESATEKISQVLDTGRGVQITYIARDPIKAWVQGVLPRIRTRNRLVPITAHLDTHYGSLDTVRKLRELYGDSINFMALDNSGERGVVRKLDIDNLPEIGYNRSELEARLIEETKYALSQGKISPEEYRKIIQGTSAETATQEAIPSLRRSAGGEDRVLPQEQPSFAGLGSPQYQTRPETKSTSKPEQIQESMQKIRDLADKLGVKVHSIKVENKPVYLDPSVESHQNILRQGGLSEEEINESIAKGNKFIVAGAHQLSGEGAGSQGSDITLFPGYGPNDVYHEFAHAVEEQGGIPGWAGTKEQHARYLSDVLAQGKEASVLELIPEGSKVGLAMSDIFGRETQLSAKATSGKTFKEINPNDRGALVQDAVQNVIDALKEAKPVRGQQETIYRKERAARLAKALGTGEKLKGEKGFYAELGALKGKYSRVHFEGIRDKVSQEMIDLLFEELQTNPNLGKWESLNARAGLAKLFGEFGGEVPTKSEIDLLNKVFPPDLAKTLMKHRPMMMEIKRLGLELINVPRAIMASYDLSAPFRQGAFLVGRPQQFVPAFGKMFTYIFSPKNFGSLMKSIETHPNFELASESKLALTNLGTEISQREEAYASSLAEKIPGIGLGIKASERAYVGFLNKLRFDTFNSLVDSARAIGRDPAVDRDLAVGIAKFVNNATGRGDIKMLEDAASALNGLFFSPRLAMSRINLLNPVYYIRQDPYVRKEALKSLLGFVGFGLTVLGLLKMAGAKVETDPTSADFGKARIGRTRVEPWAGFQQYVRMSAQLITGKYKSTTTGKKLTLGEGYKAATRWDILQRQVESKAAPVASLVMALMRGQGYAGDKINVPKEVATRFIPMVLQDAYDLAQDNPALLPLEVLGMFGMGVQTYEKRRKKYK